MGASSEWLGTSWPEVRRSLPAPPARVLELGCGPDGGYVPELRSSGYDAIGVDPKAPDGPDYRQAEFERLTLPGEFDAVVASTSLHHVANPHLVVEGIAGSLVPGGTLVVIEWDWQRFDLPTAEWCFDRLAPDGAGWLNRHRERWQASGQPWDEYMTDWARAERIHPAPALLDALGRCFTEEHRAEGPYFYPDLAGTTEADELAAIRSGEIQATRIDYAGRRR